MVTVGREVVMVTAVPRRRRAPPTLRSFPPRDVIMTFNQTSRQTLLNQYDKYEEFSVLYQRIRFITA